MSGKSDSLTQLELRKQLLIAESEVNRAQIGQDWDTLSQGVSNFAGRAKTISTYASLAAAVVAGFAAIRRAKTASANGKTSWMRTALECLNLAGSVWLASRARRSQEEQEPE